MFISANPNQVKIVFSGPVGAGKTTALATVSDEAPVQTDVGATDNIGKEQTTVAMDYGLLTLESGLLVHLYATPGQDRFSYMWDILGRGSAGLILLIDQSRPHPMAELRHFLTEFKRIIKDAPIVIGLTKMDLADESHLEKVYDYLDKEGYDFPVFEIDTREKERVKEVVLSLLFLVEPELMQGTM